MHCALPSWDHDRNHHRHITDSPVPGRGVAPQLKCAGLVLQCAQERERQVPLGARQTADQQAHLEPYKYAQCSASDRQRKALKLEVAMVAVRRQ